MTAAPACSFDLVLFDLDGTLVETAPEICDALNDTLGHLGLTPVAPALVETWIGHGTRELLVHALAHQQAVSAAEVRASATLGLAASVFDTCYPTHVGRRGRPYAHALQALRQLRERGVRTALLTNKETVYVFRLLAAHGLDRVFDRIVCGDTLAVKKPAPDGVLSCLRQFDIPRERALLVGDSSIDVATARAVGIAVWALPHGYNMGRPIDESRPDRVIPDLSALLQVRRAAAS